jgi:hypothetical protein
MSDYVYKNELTFRASSSLGVVVPATDQATLPTEGLLIWGRVENGEVTLEPAFRVPVKSGLPEPGTYTWEGHDANGQVLASTSFKAYEVADLPERTLRLFSFIVPLNADVLTSIQSMHVKLDGQEVALRTQTAPTLAEADLQGTVRIDDLPDHGLQVVWDAARYPGVMLRDSKTGEVRGFLSGGSAQIENAPDDVEVQLSGGLQSSVVRHLRAAE